MESVIGTSDYGGGTVYKAVGGGGAYLWGGAPLTVTIMYMYS